MSKDQKAFREFLDKLVQQSTTQNQTQETDVEVAEKQLDVESKKILDFEKEANEKQKKQLDDILESLEGIRKAVAPKGEKTGSLGVPSNENGELETKRPAVSSVIIPEQEKTLREKIKERVGAVKSIGEDITSGTKSLKSGVVSAFDFGKKIISDPKEAMASISKGVSSSLSSAKKAAGDVLGTEAGYTAERERYGNEYKKAGMGSAKAGRKDYDARIKEEKNKEKKDKQKNLFGLKNESKLENNVDANTTPLEAQSKDIVLPVSNTEEAVQDSKDAGKTNKILSQIKKVGEDQLKALVGISEALVPKSPKELEEQKASKPSLTEAESNKSVTETQPSSYVNLDLDLPDKKGKPTAGKKGMGSKILKGLGKAARFLGPAAAVAGAAYSGFEGYQNTNANFDIKEGEKATTGQKVSSTLGGVASGLTFGLLDEKTAAQGIHKMGSAVSDFFGGSKKKDEPAPKTGPIETKEDYQNIGGERVVAGQPLSQKQMAVIGMSKSMGNKYSPEIEAQYAKQKSASVAPASVTPTGPTTGASVLKQSTENQDMSRDLSSRGNAPAPSIVSSNVSNNNSTSFVPIKPSPRPEYSGSALDRYQNRVGAF